MQILSSCSSFFLPLVQPLSLLSSKIAQTTSSLKGRFVQTLVSLNEHYGFTRPQWVEITQMAIRALAPFVAILFVIIICPPFTAKILLSPVVMGVIFLSAFYGLPDKKPIQEESEFELQEILNHGFF